MDDEDERVPVAAGEPDWQRGKDPDPLTAPGWNQGTGSTPMWAWLAAQHGWTQTGQHEATQRASQHGWDRETAERPWVTPEQPPWTPSRFGRRWWAVIGILWILSAIIVLVTWR